jgi:hypothetical protein
LYCDPFSKSCVPARLAPQSCETHGLFGDPTTSNCVPAGGCLSGCADTATSLCVASCGVGRTCDWLYSSKCVSIVTGANTCGSYLPNSIGFGKPYSEVGVMRMSGFGNVNIGKRDVTLRSLNVDLMIGVCCVDKTMGNCCVDTSSDIRRDLLTAWRSQLFQANSTPPIPEVFPSAGHLQYWSGLSGCDHNVVDGITFNASSIAVIDVAWKSCLSDVYSEYCVLSGTYNFQCTIAVSVTCLL